MTKTRVKFRTAMEGARLARRLKGHGVLQSTCRMNSIWISAAPLVNLVITYGSVAVIWADIRFVAFFRGAGILTSRT